MSIGKHHLELAGYATFGVGLCVTVLLVSPGFTVDAMPLALTVGVSAFALSLGCMAMSALWSRWPAAAGVPPAGPVGHPGPVLPIPEDRSDPPQPT
jgi:hypothetical protein